MSLKKPLVVIYLVVAESGGFVSEQVQIFILQMCPLDYILLPTGIRSA